MTKRIKIVYCEWADACATTDRKQRLSLEEAGRTLKPSPQVTVGFLVDKQPTHITIAMTLKKELNEFSDFMVIPTGIITELKTLVYGDD